MRAVLAALCCSVALGAAARSPLVQRAEAALSRGDAAAALVDFEAAAEREHAQDIELGIVRSRMQQGEYRRALAFAAHAAGAHRDEPEGTRLYAALLRLGGQPEQAKRLLDEAGLTTSAASFGPTPSGDAAPAQVRLLAAGVLIDATHALVPLTVLNEATTLWLRDGLGRTVRAQLERRLDTLALRGADGRDRLLPASTLRELVPAGTAAPARLPLDELYERALRVTLQVLAAPKGD